jgi:tetratricopeptide (TPR) repeat protein
MELIDFSGALRIPLIGRRDYLQEAERRMQQGGTHLLYFEGEGGIGKTALLEAILGSSRESAEQGRLAGRQVAREIIDLYHPDVHTPEGLIRRIVAVIGGESFKQTRRILDSLDRARSVGNVEVANERSRTLHRAFPAEFSAVADQGVVLAFDTMEVLEYERDPFQVELGQELPSLSAGEWLLGSFLPALRGNAVILLAGRPGSMRDRLAALAQGKPGLQVQLTRLEALAEDETREYLTTVARAVSEAGAGPAEDDAAERLFDYCGERSGVVHFLAGGRPILLALVADMVAHGWTLPPSFGRTLAELEERGAEAWRPEIESALVVRIQESPTPIGNTIYALAWLRKGATAELLARVMDLRTPDGRWDIDTARQYMEQVARLTLVKVRPGEGRVFLHDEMYALLEKYVLREASRQERDRVYDAVLQYYQDQIEDLEHRIEESAGLSPIFHARFRQACVEEVHYRLFHRPLLGFATYFWRAEEALGGRDGELDMLLRTELLRTVGLLRELGALDPLDPREVDMDTAVRWGMRALFLRNDPEAALQIFARVGELWGRDVESLELARIHLRLYRAVARILRATEGDWPEARRLLQDVEAKTDDILAGPATPPSAMKSLLSWVIAPRSLPEPSVTESRQWRARVLRAWALNYQGYLDRQQGRYAEAVKHYQQSTMLQRRLGMAGLAPTLCNLAYALALLGQSHPARLLAEEAERWALRGGKEYLLALVLNIRALVEEYGDHHEAALRYTDRALRVARGLHAPRMLGLIYQTRARTHRYLLVPSVQDEVRRDPKALAEAVKEANMAVNLLRNNPPDRVVALIERGCLYRELARGLYLLHREVEAVQAARQSQQDLERAAALAGAIDLPDQQALAWVNLAWLWYYAAQTEEADSALQQGYSSIPADYAFPDHGPQPRMAEEKRREEARLSFWSTLGKAEMLRAHIALDRSRQARDDEERSAQVQEAVRHITLSLAYNAHIAQDCFDVTRAEEGLHKRILEDHLSIGELHRYADQVAETQGLQQPTRFQSFLNRMFGTADLWA